MNITMQVAVVVALCLCLADGAPDGRVARKQQRPTRGFKNMEMMTARGFGKRARTEQEEVRVSRGSFNPHSNILIARGFGKRQEGSNNEVVGLDNFWENLETAQEKDGQESAEKSLIESVPLEWFVNELVNNPDFARSVVRKFIDLNQDGMLTTDELLRNI